MNSTLQRTDIHRPSVINPEDYTFVAFEVVRGAFAGDLEACAYMQTQRRIIREHMERTGGHYSLHAHGGNCMVCGNANAIYTVLFYHADTNTYVRMGEICAEKAQCSFGDTNAFRAAVRNAMAAVAGKRKAEATLVAENLTYAWEVYNASTEARATWKYEEFTISDMVRKLVQYGSLSEKQYDFMRTLIARIPWRAELEAKRAAEKAAAAPCPNGRVKVTGTVLKSEMRDTMYGVTHKMLVKAAEGFMVWCTVPSGMDASRGAQVTFKATLKPSDDDPKFGFGSRPVEC